MSSTVCLPIDVYLHGLNYSNRLNRLQKYGCDSHSYSNVLLRVSDCMAILRCVGIRGHLQGENDLFVIQSSQFLAPYKKQGYNT